MKKRTSVTIWVMMTAIVFVSGRAMGWTQYNDGGTHDITTTINEDVWVDWEAPGMGTTVNILTGASIPSPYKLQGFNDSQLTMSDGTISWLDAHDSSRVTMSGGSIGIYLYAQDSSQVTISGGVVDTLDTLDNSEVTISGGSVDYFRRAIGNSQVTISGGTINLDLSVDYNAELTIDGSNFAIDGSPVGSGEVITSILGESCYDDPYRRLTGTLANGDIFDNEFRIGHDASIILIPEPATLVLLGLGGLFLRQKKQL